MAKGEGCVLGNSFTTKAIMIGINLAMSAFSAYSHGFSVTFSQLSYWVIVIETLHLITSLKCSLDPQIGEKYRWLAVNHMTFQIMTPMNMIVVAVYWTILRAKIVRECAAPVFYIHTTLSHSLPLLFNLVLFQKTDIVFKASHGLLVIPIGVIYGYFNYKATMRLGHPVYDFLSWTDIWTPIYIAMLTMICMAIFYSFAHITRSIKRSKK